MSATTGTAEVEQPGNPYGGSGRGPIATVLSRPRAVLTLMIAMIIGGILAYVSIPKEANPDIDVPIFYVSIAQQGISPEDAERLLIRPMETELRGLDGIKEIEGIASEGHAGIVLEFDISFDKDQALIDIREKVDQAKAELPDDAEEPQIFETNFSLIPTISVSLSGDVPERTLFRKAKELQDQIEAIPTVLEATMSGQREEIVEILIDQNKLQSYAIRPQEVLDAVRDNNQLVAAGALDSGEGRFNVKVPGLFETAADIVNLPIIANDDGVVTLGDVASIKRTFKDASVFQRFNGEPAIALQVKKRLGTNIIENNEAVREVVDSYTADWPSSINVDYALDESRYIFEVIGSLQSSIITAISLVMIVVVAALGARSAILVGIAIPTSFLLGFLIISVAGMTVNIMVLFGLVLTTGMLVDSAIVIVEYADRKMAEGVPRQQAYIQAAQRMFWPVFSSTATTLAAFIPMLLWPGVPGEFMSYLPIMVIVVLSASIVTAMVFLPVIGGLVGKTAARSKEQGNAQLLSGTRKVDVNELHGITGIYARMLLRLIKIPELVIISVIGVAVSVFVYFGANNAGVEFFVEEEPERAVVLISARGNLSPFEVRDLTVEVEERLMTIPGIRHVITTAGSEPGGSQLGDVEDKPVDTIGQITIELRDFCCRRKATEIFEDIRALATEIPGIKVEVSVVQGGPPTGKDLRLEITAQDYDTVIASTAQVRAFLENEMTGLRDIEDTRPLPGIEWELVVDREEAGRFGTDIAEVGSMIQLVTEGALVGTYRPDDSDEEIDIRVRLPREERTFDQLDQLRVQTQMGQVPLANVVERQAKPKVSTITRQNGAFSMDVKANVVEGVLADDKVRELDTWLKAQDWPISVKFRFRGADEEQRESAAFLGTAAMGALFMMFVILVTQFNSFYQTLLTLMTVVLAVVGVLIGMLVTGQRFSIIMTGTGVVALAGIVVNNSIVLMDTYNRHRSVGGLAPIDAVIRTASQRLRPIFLTTFTTIMGLIPMATQVTVDYFNRSIEVGGITSTWWVQLSTAIIFGLGFSTILTLLLIPTMLALPYVYQQRWKWLRQRFSKPHEQDRSPSLPEPANDSEPAVEVAATAKPKRKRRRKAAKAPPRGPMIPEAAE